MKTVPFTALSLVAAVCMSALPRNARAQSCEQYRESATIAVGTDNQTRVSWILGYVDTEDCGGAQYVVVDTYDSSGNLTTPQAQRTLVPTFPSSWGLPIIGIGPSNDVTLGWVNADAYSLAQWPVNSARCLATERRRQSARAI